MKTFHIRKPTSLPVSSTDATEPGLLRRRLTSLCRNQPSTAAKSVSTMKEQGGSSMKEWWQWSWSLILLKKLPIFITDLELNKDETKSSSRDKHRDISLFTNIFFKLRSEIRRILRPSSSDSLPL